jgi:hypothetical protein
MLDHIWLFRQTLRDCFGPEYIYCGAPGKLAIRKILPLKRVLVHVEQHRSCQCKLSLIEREEELLDMATAKQTEDNNMRLIRAVRLLQRKLRYTKAHRIITQGACRSRSGECSAFGYPHGARVRGLASQTGTSCTPRTGRGAFAGVICYYKFAYRPS